MAVPSNKNEWNGQAIITWAYTFPKAIINNLIQE